MQQERRHPKLPAVSLREMLHALVKPTDGEHEAKIPGHTAHWMVTKIKSGESHAACGLEHLLVDMTVRGKSLAEKLAVPQVIETYIRATHPAGGMPTSHDLKGASLREEMASARVQVLQMRAMNPADVSDLDLDRLDAFLGEQEEATREYREQVKQEKAARVMQRAIAHEQLYRTCVQRA